LEKTTKEAKARTLLIQLLKNAKNSRKDLGSSPRKKKKKIECEALSQKVISFWTQNNYFLSFGLLLYST
jgi:hypothetical protein